MIFSCAAQTNGKASKIVSDADLFTLDHVADAYDALHHGRLKGRAVVTP